MNDNMKLIAAEALCYAYEICRKENRPGGDGDHIWVSLVMGKLSELIVQECMKLNSQELSISAIERLLPLYQEHFGVEE